jgi:hypothetical protein
VRVSPDIRYDRLSTHRPYSLLLNVLLQIGNWYCSPMGLCCSARLCRQEGFQSPIGLRPGAQELKYEIQAGQAHERSGAVKLMSVSDYILPNDPITVGRRCRILSWMIHFFMSRQWSLYLSTSWQCYGVLIGMLAPERVPCRQHVPG